MNVMFANQNQHAGLLFSLNNHSWLYSETEKYNGKNESRTKNVQVLKAMHTQQIGPC